LGKFTLIDPKPEEPKELEQYMAIPFEEIEQYSLEKPEIVVTPEKEENEWKILATVLLCIVILIVMLIFLV